MQKSESINELATALAKAQGEIKGALKDSSNPFFKSKYADLSSVWEACRIPLSKNGLSVVQTNSLSTAELISVETVLMHSSGQWITGSLCARPVKNDPQGIGSCVTYLRRYSLAAMVGVCPEDDDGNHANDRVITEEHKRPTYTPKEQTMEAYEPLSARPWEDVPGFKKMREGFRNGAWKSVACHFGKAGGPILNKKLGDLDPEKLHWLRVEWLPKEWKGKFKPEDIALRGALDCAHDEHVASKEVVQESPEDLEGN